MVAFATFKTAEGEVGFEDGAGIALFWDSTAMSLPPATSPEGVFPVGNLLFESRALLLDTLREGKPAFSDADVSRDAQAVGSDGGDRFFRPVGISMNGESALYFIISTG